ncbi:hypothetical protein [Streptomyces longwoodensis]|uniref:hypothetical protein n=1 Tax=Streptomyces longwoodensis TaxID=68231 RepID=UPI003AF21765
MTGASPEQQHEQAWCLTVVTNAVVCWHTLDRAQRTSPGRHRPRRPRHRAEDHRGHHPAPAHGITSA